MLLSEQKPAILHTGVQTKINFIAPAYSHTE